MEKQIKFLLASSALPLAYDKVNIDGIFYRDGGIIAEHNLPYMKALELGYKKVLAVSLENGVSHLKKFDQGSEVYIICPSESLGDLADGTLDFDPKNAESRMLRGYRDGLRFGNEIINFFDMSSSVPGELPAWVKARLRRML